MSIKTDCSLGIETNGSGGLIVLTRDRDAEPSDHGNEESRTQSGFIEMIEVEQNRREGGG